MSEEVLSRVVRTQQGSYVMLAIFEKGEWRIQQWSCCLRCAQRFTTNDAHAIAHARSGEPYQVRVVRKRGGA